MERKIKSVSESMYTLSCGEIEVNKLIKLIKEKKKEIINKYPEANNNIINVKISYDEEYAEIDLSMGYIRYETDAEYDSRMRREVALKNSSLRYMIDNHKEEAINYLKSIGAI